MVLGLALGSGSSRGWAHIGVIEALIEMGLAPSIVCGTSIGSIVGAAYAADSLEKFKEGVCSLKPFNLAGFFKIHSAQQGLVDNVRLTEFFEKYVAKSTTLIEDLQIRYASVATELESGREIWITKGQLFHAMLGSAALPGLFPPVRHQGKWLLDGGLVNPVPVSICRALGADIVIAVNLNGDILSKKKKKEVENPDTIFSKMSNAVKSYSKPSEEESPPNVFESFASAINIFEDRITKSRAAGDPPDILLSPKLAHIKLLEFNRAPEAIKEGHACVKRMLPAIEELL